MAQCHFWFDCSAWHCLDEKVQNPENVKKCFQDGKFLGGRKYIFPMWGENFNVNLLQEFSMNFLTEILT
jgi:hypothetical protein